MWAPRVMGLERIRQVPGLEQLENRAYTAVSPHVHPNLTHLSQVMEPAIEQVSERVYSATGFDVANATFVVGKDGLVVIDAMLSVENMAAALLAFREISEYPVKGVVYTHSHGDHWGGSPALLTTEQASSGEVAVIAQRQLMAEIARINGFNAPVMAARSAYRLRPCPYDERQQNYVAAMGGADRVVELAREAMDRGDNRWAIEILGYLVRSPTTRRPGNSTPKLTAAKAWPSTTLPGATGT